MSFREKVYAARAQLKDHNERSGTKDLDALFALIRPDLPVTRPGSGDSAFAEPTAEEVLLDTKETAPAVVDAEVSIPYPNGILCSSICPINFRSTQSQQILCVLYLTLI